MIPIRLAVVVTVTVGIAAIALAAVGIAKASAKHGRTHKTTKTYLKDFQGTVASPPSGSPVAGEQFQQMGTGAWQLKFNATTGALCLRNADTWCAANNSGVAKLRPISGSLHKDEVWEEHVQSGGGIHFKNLDGGYLCASGGKGHADVVVPLSQCSNSDHELWFWDGTTTRQIRNEHDPGSGRYPPG